jgi:excisionase family DNA binding protein
MDNNGLLKIINADNKLMNTSEYLDFDGAVQLLKTTPSTLYKWLQAGKIPGHKLGRQWRFLKDELEIHVSGRGSRIHVQTDFLKLSDLLSQRSKPMEDEMNTATTTVSEKIIWDAFDHGSRLIHIYPTKGKYEIAYRIKSGIERLTDIQEDSFVALDESLVQFSTPLDDGASRRIYLHRGENDVLQVRYQKLETVVGPRLTLRLFQPKTDVLPIEKITSDPTALSTFKSWLTKKSGLFLVSGATGSGKTTTLFSLINEHKNLGRLVFTIEESAELVIEGINQVEIKRRQFENFDEIFDKVYSSDPDVICLGLGSMIGLEQKIFNAAYKAAATGHIVIIQMDQATCEEALEMFKKYVGYPIDHLLGGISCQKLVADKGKVKAIYEFKQGGR